MTANHWSDALVRLDACREAVEWAQTQPDYATAWATCERGDWMLWLAARLAGPPGSDSRRPLTLAACACARLALVRVRASEDRPRVAIETAERWARGEDGVTIAAVRAAAYAAYAAAYAARDAAYAVDATATAAYAAYAVDATATAAYAAYAADATATAAYAARSRTMRECADLARQHYPTPPTLEAQP